jgi:hypothetical protein
MIQKIISGGQTGVDQAALDVAIEEGIPHGGWIPKGRLTENGPLPEKYLLQEMPTESYPARTEKNVLDADGTLIISNGKLSGGSELTQKVAAKHNRPHLHIDLLRINGFKAAQDITAWIADNQIKVLNVAGPRASKDPRIYDAVRKIITTVLLLDHVQSNIPDPESAIPGLPGTVDEAVSRLVSELAMKDKAFIARIALTTRS